MWLNLIKAGGYAMMGKEIIDHINAVQYRREREVKRAERANLAVGMTLGSLLGAVAGILFAPGSGQETRSRIAAQACEVYGNIRERIVEERGRVKKQSADSCITAADSCIKAADSCITAAGEQMEEQGDADVSDQQPAANRPRPTE